MSYTGDGGEVSAVHVSPDDARSIEFSSGTVGRFIAPGSLTAGRFGLYRWDMPPRAAGASGHFHRRFSESFFVLSGAVTLYDGSHWGEARPGDFLFVPEGGIHGFRNDADEPASMLILFAPGAPREQYFEELDALTRSGRKLSPDQLTAFYARHDQFMVEPPR